jgi:hypothetical protein
MAQNDRTKGQKEINWNINANAFGGTFVFFPILKAKQKNAKEPPSQYTTTDQMNGQTIYRQEGRTANI